MDEVFAGAATPVQLAGLVVALRAKGETVEEVSGIADGDARGRQPDLGARPPARRRRHGRRPLDVGQHLDHGGDRRRGCRRPGGQARQPVRLVAVRLGRRARGARHPPGPHPGPRGRGRGGGRHHLLLLGRLPPRDAPRRGPAPRARHRDDVQHPRPADQPRASAGAGHRLRRQADGTGDGRRACRSAASTPGSSAATTASTSSPRRPPRRCGASTGERSPSSRSTPPRWASPAPPPRTSAAATPPTTPTSYAVSWRASRGRCVTPWCSTPVPRSRSTTHRTTTCRDALAAGVAKATEAIDSGSAQAALERWVAATAR